MSIDYGVLDPMREKLAGLKPGKRDVVLEGNRKEFLARQTALHPPVDLERALDAVVSAAANRSGLDAGVLDSLFKAGGGVRETPLASFTPSHQPMPPAVAAAALERFLEWTRQEAFRELQSLEKAALTVARMIEIAPFQTHNLKLGELAGCVWLLEGGLLLPLGEAEKSPKYLASLDAAFRLEMQPLLEHLIRSERQAFALALGVR